MALLFSITNVNYIIITIFWIYAIKYATQMIPQNDSKKKILHKYTHTYDMTFKGGKLPKGENGYTCPLATK